MAVADDLQAERNRLYNKYFPYRELPIPFQAECAVALTLQLQVQEALGIKGDFLEAGVQHGGTAFLTLAAGRPGEKHVLIDMQRSERFEGGSAKLPDTVKREIDFRECLTSAPELADLDARRFRWIHIDAGHLLQDVAHDLERFVPLLAPDGIVVLDDIFQWRWPEVTEAIQAYFSARRGEYAPLVLGFNKISFCRTDMHARYLAEIEKRAVPYFDGIGHFLLFRKTYLGGRCFAFTGSLLPECRQAQLPAGKLPGSQARLANA